MPTRFTLYKQKGLTLLETVIATTVAALISTGLWQIFISTKQSYLYQDSTARLLENSRLAIMLLSRDIRMADKVTLNGTGTDRRLVISYKDDRGRDCNNNRIKTPDSTVINQYYLKGTTLMCHGNGGPPQPMVDSIDAIRFLFGEGSHGSVNRYTENPSTNIINIRLTLLIREKTFTTTIKLPNSKTTAKTL